jgi:hypothetical protein
MNVQISHTAYVTAGYQSLERYINYFYQADAVRKTRAQSVLFIGVGDSVVPDILRKQEGLSVTTMDFDKALRPDVVGDICELPFPDNSFDAICAFEVLEHVPYEKMKIALEEMRRVSKKDVVISVPHRRTGFEILFKFPFIRSLCKKDFLRAAFRIPLRFGGFETSGQHYWEIDGHTTKLSDFRQELEKKFEIKGEKTPEMDLYRRFFYLQAKK